MSNQRYPSAVHSATFVGDDNRKVPGQVGCKVTMTVTVVPGVDTVQLVIEGKDEVSGVYYAILSSVAGAGLGTVVLTVQPGITPAANVAVADVLPDVYRIRVVHSAASAFTYSVGVAETGS